MGKMSDEARHRFNEHRRLQRALYRLDHPRSPKSQNKIKKNCLFCGAEFWVFPCLVRVQCCSRKCASQIKGAMFRRPLKPVIRPCRICGKEFDTSARRTKVRIGTCLSCTNAKCLRRYHEKYKHKFTQEQKDRHRRTRRMSYARAMLDPHKRKLIRMACREVESRRRAQKIGTRVGRVSYKKILEVFGMICYLCHLPIEEGELSFDHVIPLARGGSHTTDNIRPAHKICNCRKSSKLLEELQWPSKI